jgi:hypothetical protein
MRKFLSLRQYDDLRGARSGSLVVQKSVRGWLTVKCACGTVKKVGRSFFVRGKVKSCGCLHDKYVGDAGRTHGMSKTPEYQCWMSMNRRCRDPRVDGWMLYGARGISVCDAWRNSFEAFHADMGARPSLAHTLDRWPDRHGNYEPGNVRWATAAEQSANKDETRLLTIDGVTMSIPAWSRKSGVSASTIRKRHDAGWPHRQAVWTPSRNMLAQATPAAWEWQRIEFARAKGAAA